MEKKSKSASLVGKRYGKLTVISQHSRRLSGRVRHFVMCRCDCGNDVIVRKNNLVRGARKTCGCSRRKVMPGGKYGSLTAIKRIGSAKNKSQAWECLCDCGEELTTNSRKLLYQSTDRNGRAHNLHCGKCAPVKLLYPPTPSPYPNNAGALLKKYRPCIKYLEHTSALYEIAMDRLIRACFLACLKEQEGTLRHTKESYIFASLRLLHIKTQAAREVKAAIGLNKPIASDWV